MGFAGRFRTHEYVGTLIHTPCDALLGRAQQELEISTRQDVFVDSSVSDSIRTCIAMGNHKAAQKLRVDFKVSVLQSRYAFALGNLLSKRRLEAALSTGSRYMLTQSRLEA